MILTEDVLAFLGGVAGTKKVARAAADFAGHAPLDFAVLAAGSAACADAKVAGQPPWRAAHASMAAVVIVGVKGVVSNVKDLAEAFAAGKYAELRDAAAQRFADAVLRLDEWLLAKGLRAETGRDAYTLDWRLKVDFLSLEQLAEEEEEAYR